jgi:hypothetical protein
MTETNKSEMAIDKKSQEDYDKVVYKTLIKKDMYIKNILSQKRSVTS